MTDQLPVEQRHLEAAAKAKGYASVDDARYWGNLSGVNDIRELAQHFARFERTLALRELQAEGQRCEALTGLLARVAELEALLADVRDNGLIYWEPNTGRGADAKARMVARIDRALVSRDDG